MFVVVTGQRPGRVEGWSRCGSPKDSSALSAWPGWPPLPSSPRELWNFLALLTVPFAMCLCPPSGPHLWSPVCHLPLQELPTTNLFLSDLVFLPSLTLPLYIMSFPHFVSPPFFPIPVSHDLLCLFFTLVPTICTPPTVYPWSP